MKPDILSDEKASLLEELGFIKQVDGTAFSFQTSLSELEQDRHISRCCIPSSCSRFAEERLLTQCLVHGPQVRHSTERYLKRKN